MREADIESRPIKCESILLNWRWLPTKIHSYHGRSEGSKIKSKGTHDETLNTITTEFMSVPRGIAQQADEAQRGFNFGTM